MSPLHYHVPPQACRRVSLHGSALVSVLVLYLCLFLTRTCSFVLFPRFLTPSALIPPPSLLLLLLLLTFGHTNAFTHNPLHTQRLSRMPFNQLSLNSVTLRRCFLHTHGFPHQSSFATSKTFNSHSTPPPSSFQIHWFWSLVQQSPDRVQSLDLHRRQYITGSCRWVPLELPLTSKTTPSKNSQPTPYRLPYTSYDSASTS